MKPLLRSGLMILFFALVCERIPLTAQMTPMSEIARNIWLQKNPQVLSERNFKFDRITEQGELAVFERFNPASFIILVKKPEGYILAGYSFNNIFFGGLSGQARQTEVLEAIATAARRDPDRLKGTRSLTNSLGPLIQSQWGQGKFFNYYCPLDSRGPNGRVYAGCVAVAVGQIIRYFGGFNSINLQYSHNGGNYGTLDAQIGPYDWSAMENAPISVNLEISDFLFDLGVLLHMCYGASGSTTNSHRTLEVFHELGYIGGVISRKSKFSIESWSEIFYQNLSEYKPILVTGGGHAFICDGYNLDGLFHFNMGWDGYADGYYPLSGVLTLPVNEAFTELEPVSWPKPPKTIGLKASGRETMVTWNYESDQKPLLSRVYVDDRFFLEIADTSINISQLNPGIHKVNVSAVYPDGESRWIGPTEVFVRGAALTIKDPALYSIFQRSLGHGISDTKELQIYEGDLSRITSLDIDQPLISMEGIGLCNHLQRLTIHGFPGLTLDAGPLQDLTQLRILEWNGRTMIHPESLGKLNQLSELRIRQTPVVSLDFLAGFNKLMKFEYSDAPVGKHDAIPRLPLVDELVLRHTNLSDAGFVSGMPQLISLDLSGNNLGETGFLSALLNLNRANLSDNHITKLLLTDKLQSLHELDVSHNDIAGINITAELKLLHYIDLSENELVTPCRLFVFTPALTELNLSNNRLRDMGKQRCPNLETLDVSYNHLITTEWISLQPQLKKLDLEHNRISDLSGLTRNNLFRQLNFLGLEKNPLSKQSFLEWLPILVNAIDTVSKPDDYQPLSPCYISPADGSRLVGSEMDLQWVADNSCQKCVYDLFIFKGDSLVPVMQGLETCRAALNQRPAAAFSWVVASRTADSVYYSGVNDVVSTAAWPVPFKDGFETYREGEPFSEQTEFWFITGDEEESDLSARIVSSNSRTGLNSLELRGNEAAILSAEHLKVYYLSIEFSALIPPGQQGEFRVQNMNGMYLRLEWDATDLGKFYVNDKIYSTFNVDHLNWTDYKILAHARNNSIFVKAGEQLLINESWKVPEGIICAESIGFSIHTDGDATKSGVNSLFIDDVNITSSPVTSGIGNDRNTENLISVYPNPFVDHVNISFSRSGRYQISIINSTGSEVYREMIDATMNSSVDLPLARLTPGVYVICTDEMNSRPFKIIKN